MNFISKSLRAFFLPVLAFLALGATVHAQKASGIELGLQCYTYRSYTFFDTLDKAVALNIQKLQAYRNQELGGGLEGQFGPDMTKEQIKTVKGWLKERDLKIVSLGVVGADDAAGWKKLVAFAKEMDIGTITTEVAKETFPIVAEAIKGTKIRIALHNHPTPSRYADPAVALAAVQDMGPQWGICADTGHWTRSGYDAVTALASAKGKIFELHFKDVSEPAPMAHDMPWGTGIGNAAGQIAELRRQNFQGVAFIEYEYNTGRIDQEIAVSAQFFRAALKAPLENLVSGKVTPPGYSLDARTTYSDKRAYNPGKWASPKPLLKQDLSNAEFAPGSWVWEGDVLVAKGGGDLWTKESYGDFALSLEFKTEASSNSGVFLRGSDIKDWLNNAIEVQILQGDAENPRHVVGSLFDVLAPNRQLPIEPGTWNKMIIVAEGANLVVYLNGEQVVKADLGQWTTAGKNPDGSANKFAKAYRDMAREGRIGLQYHDTPISFRNLLIERL